MQDRYAGDVGDFGKFTLLKSLLVDRSHKLGVVWYLFPDEDHNGDGGHIGYVLRPRFLNCNRVLCEQLAAVVAGSRSVTALQDAAILPPSTVYFTERLDFHVRFPSRMRRDREERLRRRTLWLSDAILDTRDCNIVFLDPDNGLQIESCPRMDQLKSGKYAYYSEISLIGRGKQVCVVYHHLNHHRDHGTHQEQIEARIRELRIHVHPEGKIMAVRFWPYSPRAYFVLTTAAQHGPAKSALQAMLSGPSREMWSYHEEE